jgi:hypothetical protein
MNYNNNFNMLKLKNLLLDKWFCVAQANEELSEKGAWSKDWNYKIQELDLEITTLIKEMEKINEKRSIWKWF